MRRRVFLAGVGLSSVGVGAAFGSGAFTTVSADRTVDLSVNNDANARIGFTSGTGASGVVGTNTESGSAETITITQADLNEQATTTFESALAITNNGEIDDPAVDLYVESATGVGTAADDALDFQRADTNASLVGAGNAVELATDGGSVAVDIVVTLQDDANKSALEAIGTVTFVAEATSGTS